jgi:acetylglutamate kinase
VKVWSSWAARCWMRRNRAIRLAAQIGRRPRGRVELVVVHGGGKQMTRYLAERGIESRFVGGCASPRRKRSTPC